MVQGPTDGGIVVFGAPGSRITNNTIWVGNVSTSLPVNFLQTLRFVLKQTLLGGINMVDYDPFQGDYTDTVVQNNTIFGGFATDSPQPGEKLGVNTNDAIIKCVS
jgi:hypothetical protein